MGRTRSGEGIAARGLEARGLFDRFTGKRRAMRKKLVTAGRTRQLCQEAERKAEILHSVLG